MTVRSIAILFLITISAVASAVTIEWNNRAGFGAWPVSETGYPETNGYTIIAPLSPDSTDFSLRLMLRISPHKRGKVSFTLILKCNSAHDRYISITDSTVGLTELTYKNIVRIANIKGDTEEIFETKGKAADFSTLTIRRREGVLTLEDKKRKISLGNCPDNITAIGLYAPDDCSVRLHSGRFTHRPPLSRVLSSPFEPSEIDRLIEESTSAAAGRYGVYSSILDSEHLGMGGNYQFALLPDAYGGYLVIYLEGADTNASAWHKGMIKAHLTPSSYPGVYNTIWYDAEGNPLRHSVQASFIDDMNIRIIFPFQSSELTLRRIAG